MHTVISRTRLYILSLLSLALCLTAMSAQAVPSFARQTGMPCQSCHTVFPELTAFGRSFKLNGYTMTSLPQVKGKNLSLNKALPISVMLQTGFTHLNKKTTNSSGKLKQNNSVEFPQEFSIYYAGALTKHMGAFLQVTYDQPTGGGFGFDMADFRYANRGTLGGKTLVYGATLNNMPGMEDVWHTTPAFRFPYAAPDTENGTPGPDADVLVNSLMGAGLGAYALWDNQWYGMVSFYRTAMQGSGAASPNSVGSIEGLAPYVRLAWQKNLSNMGYLEIGTYALRASYLGGRTVDGTPANGIASVADKYLDVAVDATYQHPMGNSNQFTLHAVYIHEAQTLDSTVASSPDNTLKQTRIDGNYELGHDGKLTLGYFNTQGTTNATLYSANRTNNPDSAGFIAEADYLPWENTKFSIQYTNYTKFNGASSNYDGSGRNASDNNTLYLNAWWMW